MMGGTKVILGVCISCHADMDAGGGKKYIGVRILANDLAFREFEIKGDELSDKDPITSSPIPDISQLTNITVQVRKIPPREPWNESKSYINQEATSLLVSMDPKSEFWSFSPDYWQSKVGSVLVTGVGGVGITPQEVEALCAYSRVFFEEHMQDAEEEDCADEETVAKRKIVVDDVSLKAFRAFFEEFKLGKLKEDPTWNDSVEPVVMLSDGTTSFYIETS